MTKNNYYQLIESIHETAISCGRSPKDLTLVAVTKNHSINEIMELYQAGCRIFGENKIQEATDKIVRMPKDCIWHMIGTLQKNKTRKAVEIFNTIESVDTPDLAKKISGISQEQGKMTPIFLQVNTSGETTKHGLDPKAWASSYSQIVDLPGLRIEGLMTMAPFIEDKACVRRCFSRLRKLRDELPGIGGGLSMGMSNDYKEAIAEGATLLRIGSLLFF